MCAHPPYRLLWQILAFLLLLFSSVACGAKATPTPTPTLTPTPVAAQLAGRSALALVTPSTAIPATRTPLPTPTPATGTAVVGSFTIPLPASWHYQLLAEGIRTAELAQIHAANPLLGQWVQQVDALRMEEQPWLLAWPIADDRGVGLLAYVTPSFDLTIQRYLDALQRLLEETETVVVHEATLDYAIQETHPVGYLSYTLTTVQPTNASDGQADSVAGYQYLMFDQAGTTLLVMTFILPQRTSPAAQPSEDETRRDEFNSIVQSVTLNQH